MKQLTRLKITNLFGRRTYDIDFAAKEGFTFLAGPNGYGKSTILKLIYAISKGNFFIFDEIRFDNLEVDFVEGDKKAKLRIEKKSENGNQDISFGSLDADGDSLMDDDQVSLFEECANTYREGFKRAEELYKALKMRHRRRENPILLASAKETCCITYTDLDGHKYEGSFNENDLREIYYGEIYPREMSLRDFRNYAVHNGLADSEKKEKDESLSELFFRYVSEGREKALLRKIPKLQFFTLVGFKCIYVGANRQSSVDVVSDYIRRTAEQLKKKNAEISQSLDVSLLSNILQGLQKSKKDAEELRDEVDTKLVLFRSLNEMCEKVGFAYEDKGKESVFKMENLPTDSSSLVVMDLVVSNANEKLGVYTDFANRLEYFEVSINKIVNDIEIKVTVDGVKCYVIDEKVPPKDRELPLSKLSSGEQQLIAVLGEMLFDLDFTDGDFGGIFGRLMRLLFDDSTSQVDGQTLILVDEPEISMHPAWQEALSKLYFEIQERFEKDFIIATHSPAFIGERWDKVVDLLG